MPQDDAADRLEQMLDVALKALREGDEDGALLALMEASDTAERLPKRVDPPDVIHLPDQRRETDTQKGATP